MCVCILSYSCRELSYDYSLDFYDEECAHNICIYICCVVFCLSICVCLSMCVSRKKSEKKNYVLHAFTDTNC